MPHALGLKGQIHLDIADIGSGISGVTIMNIVADDKLAVRAKIVERFNDAPFAQLNGYLQFLGLKVDLLLSFRFCSLKESRIKWILHSFT